MKILIASGKRTVGIIQSIAEHTQLYVDLEYLYTETYEEIGLRLKHQLKMAEYNLVATIMVDIEIYRDQLYEISELERFRSVHNASPD